MPHLQIRPICETDLTNVVTMAHDLAAHHGDNALLTIEILARDALCPQPWMRILVAEKGASLLGYAALCPLARLQFGMRGMDMQNLFVVPDARGQGVGGALIKASQQTAKALDCSYLTVGTHPDNQIAGQVYLAVGFEPLPPHGPRFGIRL